MKLFNYCFTVIFVLFAALQYNDPDPWLWMPIYLYAAVLCWLYARGRYYPKAYLAGTAAYLIYTFWLVFTKDGVIDWYNEHHAENLVQTMKAEKPWIEDTREFGGLLILILVLLTDYFTARKKALS